MRLSFGRSAIDAKPSALYTASCMILLVASALISTLARHTAFGNFVRQNPENKSPQSSSTADPQVRAKSFKIPTIKVLTRGRTDHISRKNQRRGKRGEGGACAPSSLIEEG